MRAMKQFTYFAALALLPLALSAGTPKAPSKVCIDDECSVDEPVTAGKKWHPGHYMIADNGSTLAKRLGYCDEIGELPYIKGLQVRYLWADFEKSQGAYDFSA